MRNSPFRICATILLCLTALCCTAADRILFTRLGPSEASLFVSNADGSGERGLTQGALDYNPAWSPDGKWIAFTSERDGSADLYRIRTDGSGLERLTDDPAFDDQAAFSPDGSQIVFVTTRAGGTANLWILEMQTHRAKPLTSGRGGDFRPAWSPRGDLIAFVRRVNGDFDVFTVRTDGKDMRQLTHAKGNDAHPSWSPDGEKIVFTTTRMGFKDEALYTSAPQPYGELFVMRYDGTQLEQLTDNQWEDGGPAWQPRKK